jgi:predicted lipid-binding transport protein (Tim44 family)
LLGDIQTAYSREDLSALRAMLTPEMLSYFSEQLAANVSRGLINRVTDVKLRQGDLAEAWREGRTDYATVAMKYELKDGMVERASGRTVDGGERSEVTEWWTFMRARGGNWPLSAIQQTRRSIHPPSNVAPDPTRREKGYQNGFQVGAAVNLR